MFRVRVRRILISNLKLDFFRFDSFYAFDFTSHIYQRNLFVYTCTVHTYVIL